MKRILSVSIPLLLCACADEFSTLCYDKPLGYDEVCDTKQKYYDKKMCDEWQKGAYDEESRSFDNNYRVGPVRECIENVEVK